MSYTVRPGETIGDAVINATGRISNWNDILNANSIDTWTPELIPDQELIIPDSVIYDLNALKQMQAYPLCNFSVNDVYAQIQTIFNLIT